MFIKSITLENNPIYGNAESIIGLDKNQNDRKIKFDFCDSNDVPYNTVILAGENGSGKSTLLNIIYDFCNNPVPNRKSEEIRTFVFQLTEDEKEALYEVDPFRKKMQGYEIGNELTIKVDYSLGKKPYALKPSISRREGGEPIKFDGNILQADSIRNIFRGIFSDVEVNYTPSHIDSTSNLEIDVSSKLAVKSSSNLATEITQLLIDIEALDSSDFAEWARENQKKRVSEGITDKRMSRFKNAFNYMFPSKRFKRVANTPYGKEVLFEEFGREVSIGDLSSGEKQIVFRGGFLLKDKLATQGAIVLIDEPEISLHPKWQLKILDFYKMLFLNEENVQTSQIFVATHSPFVIHNDNREKDKIIVLGKNEDGVFIQEEPKFFGWSSEEAIIQAFDISLDYERGKVIVMVEGPTDEKYIRCALELFEKSDLPVLVQWVGRKENAGDKFTGDTALKHTKEYLLSNSNLYNNTFILLYDSDTKIHDEDIESANLFIRRSPKNGENNLYQIGIENLLTLPHDFKKENFYDKVTSTDNYGATIISQKLNKIKLCNWICDELDSAEQRVYLSKIETSIIKIIEDIIKKS
ncbi:AAA family ATPase [Bacillus toyonensis]|uniref:AAA family ATPase n=1 Tax=Bacillus toyonensis TaxID=155322 RepID=UPI00237927CA|nr:AAA family ATPase [Bacillus toyonensis]MDD9265047.1 AAA family ATPase [Bacillus toyonensis]